MENQEAKYTFFTVIAGIVFLLIVFLVTVIVFRNSEKPAETIVAILGAVTGILGTLVGYIAGKTGKDKADQRADKATKQLTAVIDSSAEGVLERAMRAHSEFFK